MDVYDWLNEWLKIIVRDETYIGDGGKTWADVAMAVGVFKEINIPYYHDSSGRFRDVGTRWRKRL